jgi:hypothetical protein
MSQTDGWGEPLEETLAAQSARIVSHYCRRYRRQHGCKLHRAGHRGGLVRRRTAFNRFLSWRMATVPHSGGMRLLVEGILVG